MNRLIVCMQAYNEESMIKYSLPSVYNDCDEVILIDGAVEGWFPTIHSTDDTVEIAKSIDVDKKLTVVQKDGFWGSLELLKHEFTKYVPIGDYFCILDADELYEENALSKLRKVISARPQYTDFIAVFKEFAFDLKHILTPQISVTNLTHQRIVKNEPGARWDVHHPTMAAGPNGQIDTCFDKSYDSRRIVIPDLNIYHLACIKPVEFQIQKRMRYYTTFDKLPPGLAKMKAEEDINSMKDRLLYYDGPLPKVLEDHPLNQDTLGGKYRNWLTAPEYRDSTRIPIIYNRDYVPPPSFSVVVTCYNNLEVLRKTLPTWKEQTYPCEIIVVEDGKPNGIADTGIKEYVEELGYIYRYNDSGESYCIASARNMGIWASTKDRVLLSDSDCKVGPDFVLEHAMASEYNNITIGPRYHIDDEGNVIAKDPREDKAFPLIEKGMKFDSYEDCHGCNMSVPRGKLLTINGFDEATYDGNWGCEDVDLAYRLISMGYKVRPVPSAQVFHIDHPSREREGQRELLTRKMKSGVTVVGRPTSWK